MKTIRKYAEVLAGCLLVALSLNLFYRNHNLIPSGIFGFAILYHGKVGMDLSLVIFLLNLFFFVCAFLFIDKEQMKKMVLTFLTIPALTFITMGISSMIDLNDIDPLLMCLYGGVLMGIGFKLIYRNRLYSSGSDVIMLVTREINKNYGFLINYIVDALWIIIGIYAYGFEGAMYSLISIIIIEGLSKRATIGVSDAKVFYIITKFDKEIRNYIIDELGYELTIFDVKGGFLKTKNKVLMCAIPTKDYYKLKEGVKMIDPKAFISITDSYEVVNPNKTLKAKKELAD